MAARQGPLGALMAAASALEEQEDQRGRGGGLLGWGGRRGGLGGEVREKGCFGDGVGGVLCTYIAPNGECDGRVKSRGWGCESGQKETPSGQTESPSGQKT